MAAGQALAAHIDIEVHGTKWVVRVDDEAWPSPHQWAKPHVVAVFAFIVRIGVAGSPRPFR